MAEEAAEHEVEVDHELEHDGDYEHDYESDDDESVRLSRRFLVGVGLIIASLVLGKLVLIPLLVFPDSRAWRIGSIVAYLATWVMLVPGLGLAGMEGYRLSKRLYKDYRRRALVGVRTGSRLAARGAVKVVKTPVQVAPKVARGAVKVVKTPVQVAPKVARGAVRVVKRPLEALRRGPDDD